MFSTYMYFDGTGTIVFTCFVVSVVSVCLSVHCITTIEPLQYVSSYIPSLLFLRFYGLRHALVISHHSTSEGGADVKQLRCKKKTSVDQPVD